MASTSKTVALGIDRRIRRVQTIIIAWMSIETVLSLFAAWRAHSPALFAFGGDSAIELLSAAIVLWGFRSQATQALTGRSVDPVVGALLFILAAYVVAISTLTLAGHGEPKSTILGIAILIAAAIIMPVLSREKRKLSAARGSAALRADALPGCLNLLAIANFLVFGDQGDALRECCRPDYAVAWIA